jgi:hypothetical protein
MVLVEHSIKVRV